MEENMISLPENPHFSDIISSVREEQSTPQPFLQEFGCNQDRYDPYEKGPEPQFRDEKIMWF